jgi:HAD superfamily hydrolase (TIGR01459 family)
MTEQDPPRITAHALLTRYDALLIDAYGVLVHHTGALPGARELLAALRQRGRRFYIVTNDASRSPERAAARYRSFGLEIEAGDMIASGMLLAPHFAARDLRGARCLVLGTADSHAYVAAAGGIPARHDQAEGCEVVVVADDEGYPFPEAINDVISHLYRRCDRGQRVELVLPNPDLVFPAGDGRYGITAGAVALLIEAALERRYGRDAPRFIRLGKPHPGLFEEARRRAGAALGHAPRLVMIGDQLETDIAGALAAGIDAALLVGEAAVSQWRAATGTSPRPTYLLTGLDPGAGPAADAS